MDEIRCAIELRADESRQSPGRITGTLIEYGKRASDRAEVFVDGALTWPDRGVVLNEQHARTQAVMRFLACRGRPRGQDRRGAAGYPAGP